MDWFNLKDIYTDKEMRDTYSSYRSRVAGAQARHVRHLDIPREAGAGAGRPARVTLITREGVDALYAPAAAPAKLKPYVCPMRLTDKARQHIAVTDKYTLGLRFSTEGLEKRARILDTDQFIAVLVKIGNVDLIEPDFINL